MNSQDIATPPDAVEASSWVNDDGEPFRTFVGSSWRVRLTGDIDLFGTRPDIALAIHGHQFADGRCERWLVCGDLPEDLSPATVQSLGRAFAEAHAEIERLASTPTSLSATPAPAERSRRAAKASFASWGNTEDRTARTAPGRRKFEQRFLDQANGDPKRAAALRKAYFMDLTEKSIKARKSRGQR